MPVFGWAAAVLVTLKTYQTINSVVGILALTWFVQGIVRRREIDAVRRLMAGRVSRDIIDVVRYPVLRNSAAAQDTYGSLDHR